MKPIGMTPPTARKVKEIVRGMRDGPLSIEGASKPLFPMNEAAIVFPTADTGTDGMYTGVVSLLDADSLDWFDTEGVCYVYEAFKRALTLDNPYVGVRFGDYAGKPVYVVANCCGRQSSRCFGSSCGSSLSCPSGGSGGGGGGSSRSEPHGSDPSTSGSRSRCTSVYQVVIGPGYCIPEGCYRLTQLGSTWTGGGNGWGFVVACNSGGAYPCHLTITGPGDDLGVPHVIYGATSFDCDTGATFIRGTFPPRCCSYPLTIAVVVGDCTSSSVPSSSSSQPSSSSSSSGSSCCGPATGFCVALTDMDECPEYNGVYSLEGDYCDFSGTNCNGQTATLSLDPFNPGDATLTFADATYEAAGTFDCTSGGDLLLVSFTCSNWPGTLNVAGGTCPQSCPSSGSSTSSGSSGSSGNSSNSSGSSSSTGCCSDAFFTVQLGQLEGDCDPANGTWCVSSTGPCEYQGSTAGGGTLDLTISGSSATLTLTLDDNNLTWRGSDFACSSGAFLAPDGGGGACGFPSLAPVSPGCGGGSSSAGSGSSSSVSSCSACGCDWTTGEHLFLTLGGFASPHNALNGTWELFVGTGPCTWSANLFTGATASVSLAGGNYVVTVVKDGITCQWESNDCGDMGTPTTNGFNLPPPTASFTC